ncbi:hypothetical protein GCM10022243_48460 [Saccharothrix violaceirubra]|uniref:Uncharacterized protein n=1 Tax=Saccharothrix violaceirubra TaxID=413306 RepID=A0A7W7WUH3_9PSEU|nr:hypothetical protein [Saccharothrix violaceirubra]MBB4963812.1 hypothetical protein [Saccharothrix violaceirubra]
MTGEVYVLVSDDEAGLQVHGVFEAEADARRIANELDEDGDCGYDVRPLGYWPSGTAPTVYEEWEVAIIRDSPDGQSIYTEARRCLESDLRPGRATVERDESGRVLSITATAATKAAALAKAEATADAYRGPRCLAHRQDGPCWSDRNWCLLPAAHGEDCEFGAFPEPVVVDSDSDVLYFRLFDQRHRVPRNGGGVVALADAGPYLVYEPSLPRMWYPCVDEAEARVVQASRQVQRGRIPRGDGG